MARRYKANPCVMNRRNPWYAVGVKTGQVMSDFPFFTEDDGRKFLKETHAPPGIELRRTSEAVEEGDFIAPTGNVVSRKKLMRENPTMPGKPKLWFPAKGSEAAKDLGSLLGKMRKASPEEKIKLKVLFKKTREKWMARESSEGGRRKNPLVDAVAGGIASGLTMAALNGPKKNPFIPKGGGGRPTIGEAKKYLGSLGFVIKKDEADDFVVKFRGDSDEKAYFTNDLSDAISTAEDMFDRTKGLGKYRKNKPFYVVDKDAYVVGKPHETKGEAVESAGRFNFFAKTVGRHHGGSQRYGHPFTAVDGKGKQKKEGDFVFDNPHLVIIGNPPKNGVALPKRLERQVMKCPAKDRPELMKGLEKYYEFHGCFPPKIIARNVDHSKAGLPLVNVGLGWSDNVEYRSTNEASNKFFAGGKGKYVHKFGDELPKGQKARAKPLLVTDPEGKTLHYLPSRFKVKDWIHH